MVTCKLYGRLANQAFQIAATIGYARIHGLEYHIPHMTLNNKVWEPKFTHLTNDNFDPTKTKISIKEQKHSYYELPFTKYSGNIELDGYWQSIKYFEHCIDEIRRAFNVPTTDQVPKDAVAVHIRRGDYVNLQDKHPVVTVKYLRAATLYMELAGFKKFMIFSDDIPWCKENITWLQEDPQFSEGNSDLEDFNTMMKYQNFIICNSTFSLMAAILARSEEKFCISPTSADWFGPGNSNLDTSTIIPENFMQIPYY